MNNPASRLAKLSRPRLSGVVQRNRLFSVIDDLRASNPGIWLVGPPGAGKSTLAASYLEQRDEQSIWYQVDASDSDPASFFYYLGMALPGHHRKHSMLPLLTPEYLGDLEGFSRRFFRKFFDRLEPGASIALDNVQHVASESPVAALLVSALEEIPDGIAMLFLSREDPPKVFSRSRIEGRLRMLDSQALQFDVEETARLAASKGVTDRTTVQRLMAQSNGWAAGLTLLLELPESRRAKGVGPDGSSLQLLFDYFAVEVFETLSVSHRHALARLAFTPQVTSWMAEALCNVENVPAFLDNLYRRRLFTDKRTAGEPTWHFHALFSAYLEHELRRTETPSSVRMLALESARILASAGFVDDSASIYIDLADWRGLGDLMVANAGQAIATGRWKAVVGWGDRIPMDVARQDPWILHWRGIAEMSVNPPAAREKLEAAVTASRDNGDRACFVLSVAGIIECYCAEFNRFAPMDPWIPVLADALESPPEFDGIDAELRVWSALLSALHYRHPEHPSLARCIEHVLTLLEKGPSLNIRVHAATHLMNHGGNNGDLGVTKRAAAFVIPVLDSAELSPLVKAGCLYAVAWYLYLTNQRDACADAVRSLIQIGVDEGFPFVSLWGHTEGFILEAILNMDVVAATHHLRQMEALSDPSRSYDRALCAGMAGWLGVARRDPDLIFEHADIGNELVAITGIAAHTVIWQLPRVWALVERGAHEEAVRAIAEIRALETSHRIAAYESLLLAAEAMMAIRQSNESDARNRIAALFGYAKREGYGYLLSWFWPWQSRLCAAALSYGVASEYVSELVTAYRWRPPDPVPTAWPWPVKIYTLGRFEIFVHGRPVEFGRKYPRKLLGLLKAMIARGGRSIPEESLVDTIWADEEADKAVAAYRVALVRLRKLLGNDRAIVVEGSLVGFDDGCVWIDAYALEACVGRLADRSRESLERVRALYLGDFLAADQSEPWAVSMRERLRNRFVEYVGLCGKTLEEQEDWQGAIHCYRNGIDASDITESYYQGLMRCHLRRGEIAEGMKVYQQLRRVLLAKLGIQPSRDSEELHHRLRAA